MIIVLNILLPDPLKSKYLFYYSGLWLLYLFHVIRLMNRNVEWILYWRRPIHSTSAPSKQSYCNSELSLIFVIGRKVYDVRIIITSPNWSRRWSVEKWLLKQSRHFVNCYYQNIHVLTNVWILYRSISNRNAMKVFFYYMNWMHL